MSPARAPMIFGFNTDVSAMGKIYHVQTEVREQESRIESQLFLRGRCIGKRSLPSPAGASEEEIQVLAREQHRWVIEAVRGGFLEDALNQRFASPDENVEAGALPTPTEATEEYAGELTVELQDSRRLSGEEVLLRLRVLCSGQATAGAELAVKWKIDERTGEMENLATDADGIVELRLPLGDGFAELDATARWQGRECSHSFLI